MGNKEKGFTSSDIEMIISDLRGAITRIAGTIQKMKVKQKRIKKLERIEEGLVAEG